MHRTYSVKRTSCLTFKIQFNSMPLAIRTWLKVSSKVLARDYTYLLIDAYMYVIPKYVETDRVPSHFSIIHVKTK